MGVITLESSWNFSNLGNLGFQEEGIHWGFVGGHIALPTISYLTTFTER